MLAGPGVDITRTTLKTVSVGFSDVNPCLTKCLKEVFNGNICCLGEMHLFLVQILDHIESLYILSNGFFTSVELDGIVELFLDLPTS